MNVVESRQDTSSQVLPGPSRLLSSERLHLDNPLWYRIAERMVAGVALLATAPIILLLMALIRLDSPGPGLFRQDRIARSGCRPFRFAKLRTMQVDAARRFPVLCAYDFQASELDQVKLSLVDDPRVTRLGKWLRQTSLDELPNLWHVVTGEMALVGPRPEMWKMLPYYDARTLRKFDVLPGVTGLAQISGRGELTFIETVDYDLEYVATKSVRTDLRIIWDTIAIILQRKGAF